MRLDDAFFDNAKAIRAGRDGRCLFLAGLCWSASQLSDGRIPKEAVASLAAKAGVPKGTARKLVDVVMWHDRGDHYEIHDWPEFNTPAEKVREERAAARARMAKLRAGKAGEVRANSDRTDDEVRGLPLPPVPSEPGRGSRSGSTPEPNLRALPAYQRPDLTPGCPECDGFGEVFDGNDRYPCPKCSSSEAAHG